MRAALTPILLAAGVPLKDVPKEINEILGPIPDIADVRVVPVVGVGWGAFAAGQAYQQVADDWDGQTFDGDPLLGSVTVLPMVLLLNPGRANGGVLARAYPVFRPFGIDTVTPETEVQSTGGTPINIGDIDTGLAAGGDNLIPIKLDVGIQNFPASDFAAWPNPVTLANNAAALAFPTYIIRGFDEDNVESSLEDQLERQLPGVAPTADKPLSFNFYLTVPINGAPVLEPTYLVVDAVNLVTRGSFNNPIGTALNPVLESAGNLGYTDVERAQNADGDWEYVRTFDDTEVPTAYGSLPEVDWGNVPGDLLNLLRVGIEQAIDDGIEGEPGPNALAELLNLLGIGNSSSSSVGSGLGLTSVSGSAEGVVGNTLGSAPQVQGPQNDAVDTVPFAGSDVGSTKTGSGQTVDVAADTAVEDAPAPTRRPVRDIIESLGNSVSTPKSTAAGTGAAGRQAPVRDAAKRAGDDVRKAVGAVNDGLKNAVKDVQKAVTDTANKMSDAAKPKAKAAADT